MADDTENNNDTNKVASVVVDTSSPPLSPNRSYISHEINDPEKKYVTIKYFPTNEQDPDLDSYAVSRSYQLPDGQHRTTITTARRTVIRTTSGGETETITTMESAGQTPQSPGKVEDMYLQHALDQMAGHGGPASKHEEDLRRAMEQIARDRANRKRLSSSDDDKVAKTSLTMTRETLRPRPASGAAPLSASGKDRVLTATGTPLVWKSVEGHDHLLKRYEPASSLNTRVSYNVPKAEPWTNIADEIIKSEVGEEAFKKRVEKQKKVFEAGAKKGFFIFDELPLFFKKWGIRTLFEKKVKQTNQRATHSEGVGALGYAVVVENNKIPENDFFEPKRMFEVRARHANFPTVPDDSRPAWRSLALKFQDHDYDSPLDLVFQSGRSSPFYNTDAIDEFYSAIVKSPAAFKEYLISLPANLGTIFEGMRKGIDSYTHVHYHSQMTYDFVAKDGKKRLARFRVVPADGYPDTGRLSQNDQRDLWFKMLLKDEHSRYETNMYLDDDFKKRVEASTVTYDLQIQLYEWQESDTNALYNPAEIWSEETYPWTDLAKIRLLSNLPDDITELTRYNIGHLPDSTLRIPDPTSKSDFNTVPTIRKEIYDLCSRLRDSQPPPPPEGDEVEYLIHIVTGDRENAGNTQTKCDTFISLIGTQSRTAFLLLDRTTSNDFAAGQRSTFTLKDKYVGDLLCVKIYKEKKGAKSDWFCDYVLVSTTYNNTCLSLPCGRWFNDESPLHILRDGTPIVFDKETDYYLRRLRQADVTMRQSAIRWLNSDLETRFQGLPGCIQAGDNYELLPGDLKSEQGQRLHEKWAELMDSNNILMRMRNVMMPRTKKKLLDEAFESELFDKYPEKKKNEMLKYVISNWRSDLEFGRQMLNGVMPLKIARLRDIPKVFPLKDEMVKGRLEGSRTLRDELQAGRLFLISYPELQEFAEKQQKLSRTLSSESSTDGENNGENNDEKSEPPKSPKKKKQPKKYLCAPHVIMYLKGGVTLLPLAIQLTQDPETVPLIYTANDDTGEYSDWLVAKMWVKVAEANMHHFAARALGTMLLLEPIAIAVSRDLPAVHPISKLLCPYLRNLVELNTIYRKFVIGEDGALSEVLALGNDGIELMRRQYSKFAKFGALNVPENISNRGVLDPNKLPGYLFRDDALRLWEAIRNFTIDIVCAYYDDDDQVRNDDELKLMLADLNKNGFGSKVDLPRTFDRIEYLVQFCTTVIFRSTVQNTALTRGIEDIYSYCLNAPPCMMRPPPTEKRPYGYSLEYLHSLMPSSDLHDRYTEIMALITQGYDDVETSLGQYHDKTITDEKAVLAIKNFQKELREISEQIQKRSRDLEDWSYEYLLPSNIPVGFVG